MGVDADLVSILREIVQFLDSLNEVDLPSRIENVRINLLQRSKTKLSTFVANRGSTSPEPYLDMNAGKGPLLFVKKKTTKESEIEEYVGVEKHPVSVSTISSHQDYYESFQEINSNNDETITNDSTSPRKSKSWQKFAFRDDQVECKLREIYKTFTVTKTMSTAHKCGSLYHKVEKKPFGFVRGNVRLCWIGLVGSHLLIYGSEEDRQPPEICSIRGYSARPAPNALPRDPERAKSAFEIFCPGNKTLQFIAKTPREMEEWLAVISRTTIINQPDKVEYSEKENLEKKRSDEPEWQEEKYQDVGILPSSNILKDPPIPEITNLSLDISIDNDKPKSDRDNPMGDLTISPPALPVRIPRRLPSLPSEETAQIASYEPLDNTYEEDDIYHKIEDFRENGRRSYENVKKSRESSRSKKITKTKKRKRKDAVEPETYDDVENKDLTRMEKNPETYDDVRTNDPNNPNDINNSSSSRTDKRESLVEISRTNDEITINYDDVFQASSNVSNGKLKNSESKESTKSTIDNPSTSPTKSPHKRSFLDRVRHRKESPKKEEKKRSKENESEKKKLAKKEKIIISPESSLSVQPTSSIGTDLELPTYDDVSELMINHGNCPNANHRLTISFQAEDEMSNYNCPPPPRPIYAKPPNNTVVLTAKNEEKTMIDEVYDDIENYRKVSTDGNEKVSKEKSILLEKAEIYLHPENAKNEMMKKYENDRKIDISSSSSNIEVLGQDERKISLDSEHYQTPRADSIQVERTLVAPEPEQLYDDIAILADFRAKQRESASSSSSPKKLSSSSITYGTDKLTISVKKPWNRFGSGKKTNSRDSVTPQASVTKIKSSIDLEEIAVEDNTHSSPEKHEASKLNKLQKLINKMESTLGKQPSTKSVATLLNKTHNDE